jgi:hypothetical protein
VEPWPTSDFSNVCTHQPLFVGYIYIAKSYMIKRDKIFFEILVARIPPNFKRIHQIYILGSSKYPKILKDFFKIRLSYLAYGQIKWINLFINELPLIFSHHIVDKSTS